MKIELRQLDASDAPFIVELMRDPLWLKFIGDRGVSNQSDAKRYTDGAKKNMSQSGYGLWCVKWNGCSVGLCGFVNRPFLRQPDLGFALLPEARGKGVIRQAIKLAEQRLELTHQWKTFSAIVHPDNIASMKVIESCGYRYAGQLFSSGFSPQQAQKFYLKSLV